MLERRETKLNHAAVAGDNARPHYSDGSFHKNPNGSAQIIQIKILRLCKLEIVGVVSGGGPVISLKISLWPSRMHDDKHPQDALCMATRDWLGGAHRWLMANFAWAKQCGDDFSLCEASKARG